MEKTSEGKGSGNGKAPSAVPSADPKPVRQVEQPMNIISLTATLMRIHSFLSELDFVHHRKKHNENLSTSISMLATSITHLNKYIAELESAQK